MNIFGISIGHKGKDEKEMKKDAILSNIERVGYLSAGESKGIQAEKKKGLVELSHDVEENLSIIENDADELIKDDPQRFESNSFGWGWRHGR